MYHVAFSKRGNTMVIETAKCVDYLSCEIYDYMGQRETTKEQLRKNRYQLLELMKKKRPEVYGDLRYAIVE